MNASRSEQSFGATAKSTGNDGPPPREVPFQTIKWSAADDETVSPTGRIALSINPSDWRHCETEHFTVHFRRITEARQVARQIEYDLWFVAKNLGFDKADYAGRSHVYIFEGQGEWESFLKKADAPPWAAALAVGDELFLNPRHAGGSSRDGGERQLSHEATHAVIARLYKEQRWPLWLNEGLAEYMSSASVAARRGKFLGRMQDEIQGMLMPLDVLVSMEMYPQDQMAIGALYATSQALVRYLYDKHGAVKFRAFVSSQLAGSNLKEGIAEVYAEDYVDWDAFVTGYQAALQK